MTSSRKAMRFRSATGSRLSATLGDRQDPCRVLDRHCPDFTLPHRCSAQGRQEVLVEVHVPESAVHLQLPVVADVLAEEQVWTVVALEELDDRLDEPRLERLLDAEAVPEKVELQIRAGVEDGEIEVEVVVGIGVANDDSCGVDSLVGEDPQLGEPDWRLDAVGRDRHPGLERSTGGGAMHALLEGADPWLVSADLSDDPWADSGVADPVGELADDLL